MWILFTLTNLLECNHFTLNSENFSWTKWIVRFFIGCWTFNLKILQINVESASANQMRLSTQIWNKLWVSFSLIHDFINVVPEPKTWTSKVHPIHWGKNAKIHTWHSNEVRLSYHIIFRCVNSFTKWFHSLKSLQRPFDQSNFP